MSEGPLKIMWRSVALYVHRPRALIPFALQESIIYTVQSIMFIFSIISLTYLRVSGRLDAIAYAVKAGDFGKIVRMVSSDYPLVTLLVMGGVVSLAAYVILESFVSAGLYPVLERALVEGDVALEYMFVRGFGGWRRVLKTVMVVTLAVDVPLTVSIVMLMGAMLEPPARAAILFFNATVLGIASFLSYVATVYAVPVASIDGVGPLRALRTSINVVRAYFVETLIYVLMRGMLVWTVISLSQMAPRVGFGVTLSSATLISLLGSPILTAYLLSIYEGYVSEDGVVFRVNIDDATSKARRVFLESFRSTRCLLRSRVFLKCVVLASTIALLGWTIGYYMVTPTVRSALIASGFISPGKINPIVREYNRLLLSVDISFHNWRTAVGTSFSGIALGLPPASILLANGFMLGALSATIKDPVLVMSIIAPHGIIEIPAFILASSGGIFLAIETIKYITGTSSERQFSEVTITVARLILSLFPVFLVAGVIEALVTPVVAGMYGWK